MKILWLNWRDIKNPDAGGAEVLTHEIMRRLITKGYELTLFSAEYPNCANEEIIDHIRIIRQGGRYGVYRKAEEYWKNNQVLYDLVIDEINTRPFLTPKFVRKPIVALFHQLAREFWFYETPFPLNYIGYYFLENRWLSHYKDTPIVTISNSSKTDLENLGFKKIFIIPEGLNVSPLHKLPEKESRPTLIFTGRLKKAKLPHHALKAFSLIKQAIPDAKMWVLGDGYLMDDLKTMNIPDVTFYGRVGNEKKYELMSRAHIALVPAVREGWGLVVTESNAKGTPAIAYNVPGLRDSVKDNETGILSQDNTPKSMAETAINLLRNREQLERLSYNALQFSKQFSWDYTTDAFERVIRTVCK